MPRRLRRRSPAPPSPRILHLRRRYRRKSIKTGSRTRITGEGFHFRQVGQQKPLNFVKQDRTTLLLDSEKQDTRNRVEEEENKQNREASEEKWRLEAEILRAECNCLRTEKLLTLKKLKNKEFQLQTILRSAIQTLLNGKRNINEGECFDAEIQDLTEKLTELQGTWVEKQMLFPECLNFDKQASLLQRRLEKLESTSFSANSDRDSSDDNQSPSFSERRCSGHCQAVVRKIVEQVRGETEQWTQMQRMLEHVKEEMEQLQASRDFWKDRATISSFKNRSLTLEVLEWKQRALESEEKFNELRMKEHRTSDGTKRKTQRREAFKEERTVDCRLIAFHDVRNALHLSRNRSSKPSFSSTSLSAPLS